MPLSQSTGCTSPSLFSSPRFSRTPLTAAIGIALALGATSAAAQSAGILEEVVVTAQKREEALKDVPISITAVSGDALEKAGISSVLDLPKSVPGLRVDLSGGFAQPSIRGVGSALAGAGLSANIATYVDGFYVPSQLTTDMQLLNISSIQVLKGPQGTLFGRNATGGAILLNTSDPTVEPALMIKGSYERYNKYNVSLYSSVGITDNLAVSLGGFIEESDGFIKNVVTGDDHAGAYDKHAVRLTALWEPSDKASVKLTYATSQTDDPRPNAHNAYQGQSTAAMIPGAIVATGRGRVSNDQPVGFESETDAAYLTVTYDLGWADLKSFTMYREEYSLSRLDLDSSNFNLFNIRFPITDRAVTQEFNLAGSSDRLDWVTGVFYYRDDNDFPANSFTTSGPDGSPFSFLGYSTGVNVDAWAVFGDATYSVTDDLHLTLGLRYSEEKSKAKWTMYNPAINPNLGSFKADEDWDNFSPRVVLRYALTPDSNVYASVSKGFKSGLLNPNGFTPEPVDPEEILAYEVGYKYGGPSARFDISAFYYDYKDLQVATYIATQNIITNAATSSIYGLDSQLTLAFDNGLSASLALAYTRAEYDDYPGAPEFNQFFDPTDPANPANGLFLATPVDASGNQMQRAPKLSGNASVTYETEVMAGLLSLNANYYYTSKIYFDPAEQYSEDSYGLLGLNANWTSPDQHWTYAVFGNNVTNTKYRSQVLPGQFAVQQTWGDPATYGVSVAYRY